MKKRINLLLVISIFLCVVGCSPEYKILVDGRTSQEYEQIKNNDNKYKIIFNDEKNKNDFDYQSVYDGVTDVFIQNGYHVIEDIFDADYIVSINFGANGPHTNTINHSTPITGQIGVDTHTTYTYGPYGMVPHTYTTPRYGTIGYDHYQTTDIFYTHGFR